MRQRPTGNALAALLGTFGLTSAVVSLAGIPGGLEITDVYSFRDVGEIHILGERFDALADPTVVLGTVELEVISVEPTLIVARLPADTPEGDHRVIVEQCTDSSGPCGGLGAAADRPVRATWRTPLTLNACTKWTPFPEAPNGGEGNLGQC